MVYAGGVFSDSPAVVGDHSFVDTAAGRAYFGWIMYGTLPGGNPNVLA